MSQLVGFRRSLRFVVLALFSAAIAIFATPASARSHQHGAHHHGYHASHHVKRHHAYHPRHQYRRAARHHHRYVRRARIERASQVHTRRYARAQARAATVRAARAVAAKSAVTTTSSIATASPVSAPVVASPGSSTPVAAAAASAASTLSAVGNAVVGTASNVVAEARRYLGGNPTGRRSLWCARFMNMVLQHTGHRGTGSDMANSFVRYGQRVSGPQVGAIAVMGRRGGSHVGIITSVDGSGRVTMISGNYGNRVREATIARGRIYAYVMPTN